MFQYQQNGNLIPGIIPASWNEFVGEFGFNPTRQNLLQGLELAITHLKETGCSRIFIDGSFVTKKTYPGDYDSCWDIQGVDLNSLSIKYPVLLDLSNKRANQKLKYKGELFPTLEMLDFFQKDRDGSPKGIVQLNF
ncbi:MAG: hypothetical protein KBF45_13810 [Cyclobacteriaceae bacterium]|nr:hypothetical protein [Cyclobacteriaceae bacterium]